MMRWVLAAGLVVSVAACTGAELYVDQELLPEAMRQASKAQLCVPDALREEVPYKLLFVIDTSGSNATSDPTPPGGEPRRETAVRQAINAHIAKTNVSFGVITFSDEPVRQTFGYTRDTTVLAGALENISQAQGGTNYSNTLWAAIDFVQNDIESLSVAEAARTHYIVFWLSDGFPTVGVTDGAAITPGVTHLCDSFGPRVARLSFNSAFLGGAGSPDDADAQDLLADMAGECNGNFINIPSGGAFSFDVDTDPVIRKYELALYAATNLNVRLGQYGPAPDSDGDGLLDAEEVHWKTDSVNLDTDNDGVRDGIEVLMQPLRSPTRLDGNCSNPGVDTDDDGLYDCEEVALGTSPTLIDTDGDLLPDGLEAQTGGLPVKDDPTGDADLDGLLDSLETRAHLPVRTPTDPTIAGDWSYRYGLDPIEPPAGAVASDRVCYDLTVDNIALRETQPTRITSEGLNRVEIWAVFRPIDLAGESAFYRARREVRLLEGDNLLDPPSGFPQVLPEDFVLVGTH